MAIKTENVVIRGISFVHTYSDAGHKIKQAETGYLYEDAYDPINSGRTYTDSDEYISTQGATTAEEVAKLKLEIKKLKAEQTTQNEAIEASADGLTDLISQVMGGES